MNTPPDPPGAWHERLRPGSRAARLLVTAAAVTLLLTGTAFGDDDAFPFGPFRMYSTSTPINGDVHVLALAARLPDGTWKPARLDAPVVGLTRAEAEGQAPRFQAHPELLQQLLDAHDRLRPREPRWTGVRLIQQYYMLRNRLYVGKREFTIAEWTRS
ncbi:hypothetical protein GCM10029978_072600 [Actinoallomurus acanthiterrae]